MLTGKPTSATVSNRVLSPDARSGTAAYTDVSSSADAHLRIRDIDRWFAERVAPHERQYLWLARRVTGNDEAARDLVHDAYASVFASGNWQGISHPRAYVMRTVFTLGLKAVRRAKVVPMQGLPEIETLDYATQMLDGYQSLSIREEMRVGMDAIRSLPEMTRQVIVMRRLDGLAIKEIAVRLGLTVKGVDYHIARGAYLFAKAIEDVHLKAAPDGSQPMRR